MLLGSGAKVGGCAVEAGPRSVPGRPVEGPGSSDEVHKSAGGGVVVSGCGEGTAEECLRKAGGAVRQRR